MTAERAKTRCGIAARDALKLVILWKSEMTNASKYVDISGVSGKAVVAVSSELTKT